MPASPDVWSICSGSGTVLGTLHLSLYPFLTTVLVCKQLTPILRCEDTETQIGHTAIEWQRQNSEAAFSLLTLWGIPLKLQSPEYGSWVNSISVPLEVFRNGHSHLKPDLLNQTMWRGGGAGPSKLS